MNEERFTIRAWRPARLNQLLGERWRASRLKKQDALFVFVQANLAGVRKATGKRRVSLEITLTGRQKQADPDAYWKSLLDALVKARLLIDDSPPYCELGTVTYNRAGEARTTIVLTDLE